METEFFGLSLSRNELLELQTALIQRYIVEDELRREKGLEPIAHHGLLCRVDELLKLQNSELDKLNGGSRRRTLGVFLVCFYRRMGVV